MTLVQLGNHHWAFRLVASGSILQSYSFEVRDAMLGWEKSSGLDARWVVNPAEHSAGRTEAAFRAVFELDVVLLTTVRDRWKCKWFCIGIEAVIH
jgi:hypothetical protein